MGKNLRILSLGQDIFFCVILESFLVEVPHNEAVARIFIGKYKQRSP